MPFHPLAAVRALHAGTGRAARALALSLVSVLAAVAGAAGAPPFSSSFPHLYYDDNGWLDGDLATIAHFGVVSTAFWNQEGPNAARLDSLHLLAPDLVRLAYLNPAGRSLPAIDDPGHVVNRLAAGIEDAWYVRDEQGRLVYFDPNIPTMPMLDLSSQCPWVGGRTWGEFIADFAAGEILGSGKWEGMLFDNMWSSAAWVNAAIPGSLDLDRNGVADPPDSVDVWWRAGTAAMLARFRAQAGPLVIAIGNGNAPPSPFLNGRYYEDFPYREGWAASLSQAADWQLLGARPSLLAMVTRSTEGDFRRMRYGLTSALVAGAFSFHYADEHEWPNPILYDEYRVDLGQPIGPPVELGIEVLGEASFETGVDPQFSTSCGIGLGTWTTDPALVIDGQGSLLGNRGAGQDIWRLFLCSDPADLLLAPGATYTVTFSYRVVAEPPPDGYFFAGARSDLDQDASARSFAIFDPPAGTVGQARGEVTLGSFPGYYLYWGMKSGGTIVIDSIRIVMGRGGVFRRDFEHGMALVNPGSAPIALDLEPGFHRIAGSVDPATNNGQAVTHLALGPEDGLVLLSGPATTEPGGTQPPATPPLVASPIFAFPNPARLSAAPAVEIAGVPGGGSVDIVTPAGRRVTTIDAAEPGGAWRWRLVSDAGRSVAPGIYLAVVRDAGARVVETLRLAVRR